AHQPLFGGGSRRLTTGAASVRQAAAGSAWRSRVSCASPCGRGTRDGAAMRVLILGGDGFCGWPTSLHLSARGHEVAIVDNGSRRRIDEELGAGSLTPIADLEARLSAWTEVSGRTIAAHTLTVGQDFEALLGLLKSFRPDAIAHFAEQRAAPYSMKSARHKRYTVGNNVSAT